jgi:hypothetical protein
LGIPNPDDYLDVASKAVEVARALRDDLLAVLFPHGSALPSELLQTRVKVKMLALVGGIEGQLLRTEQPSTRSWDILAKAGFLREAGLVQFALARIAEEKLLRNMQTAGISPLVQIPAKLLSHDNHRLHEMARNLLQTVQTAAASDENQYLQLDSALVQPLCWRIVAALHESGTASHAQLSLEAKRLLAEIDGNASPSALARKLVFFLGAEHGEALVDPREAGLHLFIAAMEQDFGLNADILLRMIGEDSTIPLIILLRARGLAADKVSGAVKALRGGEVSPEWLAVYNSLDAVEARATITSWVGTG